MDTVATTMCSGSVLKVSGCETVKIRWKSVFCPFLFTVPECDPVLKPEHMYQTFAEHWVKHSTESTQSCLCNCMCCREHVLCCIWSIVSWSLLWTVLSPTPSRILQKHTWRCNKLKCYGHCLYKSITINVCLARYGKMSLMGNPQKIIIDRLLWAR